VSSNKLMMPLSKNSKNHIVLRPAEVLDPHYDEESMIPKYRSSTAYRYIVIIVMGKRYW